MNRLVDAARPESAVAHNFAEIVRSYIGEQLQECIVGSAAARMASEMQGNHATLSTS